MSKATLISLVLIAALLAPQLARADQVSDTIAELTSQITQLRLQLITLLQQRLSSLVDQVMLLQQQQQDTNNNSNNNNYQSANPTSPTCSPASQSVLVNQTASLTASGGSGTGYVWSAPGGSPATGTGASFSTSYGTVGSKPVTLTDSNSNSSSCSVNVGSQQSGTPSVSISATPLQIVLGQPATVSWSSTNTTSCIASGGWSGTKTTSGTETVMTKQGVQPSFTIICSGPNGTVSSMTALNVFVPVSFKASASTISP